MTMQKICYTLESCYVCSKCKALYFQEIECNCPNIKCVNDMENEK